MKKFRFNMIEVTLALAIISIGLSSVMVLLSSGSRAQKEAVSNNNLPDVSEYVISKIRSDILKNSSESGWGDSMPAISSAAFSALEKSSVDAWKTITLNDSARLKYDAANNAYLFRQLSPVTFGSGGEVTEYAADFEAIVQVLRRAPVVVTQGTSGTALAATSPLAVFDVQISYPADAPDAQREKKIYRVEIYNDLYDRFVQ